LHSYGDALPPRPTPLPYTTLFRSLEPGHGNGERAQAAVDAGVGPQRDGVADLLVGTAEEHHAQRDCREHADAHGHVRPASGGGPDRKSTRLNSSHVKISYAVFCLK